MRNRKFPALIALLVAFAAITAGAAGAQTAQETGDSDVTATITQSALGGYRYISSVGTTGVFTPPLDSSSQGTQTTNGTVNLIQVGTTNVLSNTFAATVTENNAGGSNPWNLKVSVPTSLTQTMDASGAAVTGGPTIPNSSMILTDRAMTAVPTVLTTIGLNGNDVTYAPNSTYTAASPEATELALDTEQTWFEVSNQDPTKLYTGVWTATSNLELHLPNGVEAGTYEGVVRVTLYE